MASAVGRICDETHYDFVCPPPESNDSVVPGCSRRIAPTAVELSVIPSDLMASHLLEQSILDRSRKMRLIGQKCCSHRRKRDQEAGSKVRP